MRRVHGRVALWATFLGLLLLTGVGRSVPVAPDQLPEPVAKTFHAMFPNGTIAKLDAEEENGVMVYDFEFRAGGREKETDIAADGTMIESTLVIPSSDIPAPAKKAILAAAKGARLGRCEWIEMRFDLEDGKVVPMEAPLIKYAAEMRKGGKQAEVIVTAGGKVLEPPVWIPVTPAKAPPPKTGQ